MTRVVTTTTDTITLNAADIAKALDVFIRSCHSDLASGVRNYTLVTPAHPVAHFDVRCVDATPTIVPTEDIITGANLGGGVILAAGDRVLVASSVTALAGIWVAGASSGTRPTDADVVAEIDAKPYVYVAAGTAAGRWYKLDDATIVDITLANYTIVAQ